MPTSSPNQKQTSDNGAGKAVNTVKKRQTFATAIKPRNGGTLVAREQVFAAKVAAFAKGVGRIGYKPPGADSYWPFSSKYISDLYDRYDTLARGFIAEARKWQGRGVIISGNQGTAPELALLGAHLVSGAFHLGVNLFHQSVPLYGLRARDRPFIVDVAASYGGVMWLYPMDGEYFHLKSMQEVLDSQRRNWLLEAAGGRVLPITDVQCYSGMAMIEFLRSQGAPI
jgi:hypothetical protein